MTVKQNSEQMIDVSWGGKAAFSGGGTGDNIPVTKSKYKIYFNDLDGSYLMIPSNNVLNILKRLSDPDSLFFINSKAMKNYTFNFVFLSIGTFAQQQTVSSP
jgi:hypothetical protein